MGHARKRLLGRRSKKGGLKSRERSPSRGIVAAPVGQSASCPDLRGTRWSGQRKVEIEGVECSRKKALSLRIQSEERDRKGVFSLKEINRVENIPT